MKNSASGNWRLRFDAAWIVTCMVPVFVALGVYYKTFSTERSDLPLQELMDSINGRCRSMGAAFEETAQDRLLRPVPEYFGIAVWVEHETWSLPVHDTLDRIEDAISSKLTTGASSPRLVQRIVRVDSMATRHVDGENEVVAAAIARKQQLGLGVTKHVYAVDLHGELLMHGVSFFHGPSHSDAGKTGVSCFLFEERQAYCIVPDKKNKNIEWLQREVSAALATLMARWMGVESFRDASAVQHWAVVRDGQGCHYALRALQQLEQLLLTHTMMPVPVEASDMVDRLRQLIQAGKFVRLARAANDLQYHPLFQPEVYIPWEQEMVVHFSILLPLLGILLVSLRFVVTSRLQKRALEKQKKTA